MSGIARSLDISASGLTAERMRMDVISNNLANINTTLDGLTYLSSQDYNGSDTIQIVANDQGKHMPTLGAECNAQANFTCALFHCIGHYSVKPKRGEQ